MTKKYDTRADLWGFGCIVSEILKYLKFKQEEGSDTEDSELIMKYLKTKPLFDGNSCYPISPLLTDEEFSP